MIFPESDRCCPELGELVIISICNKTVSRTSKSPAYSVVYKYAADFAPFFISIFRRLLI